MSDSEFYKDIKGPIKHRNLMIISHSFSLAYYTEYAFNYGYI